MTDDRPICVRCAERRQTCCQISEVYTTPGDVERIRRFSGREGFTEMRAPENPAYLPGDEDGAWSRYVFRSDGTRRVLQRRESGDCTFLGSQGCLLPLEVRPLVCRLYPYDYDESGFREELATGCPTELLRPGQSLIEALDMQLGDARRWHRQLYQELPMEEPRCASA